MKERRGEFTIRVSHLVALMILHCSYKMICVYNVDLGTDWFAIVCIGIDEILM